MFFERYILPIFYILLDAANVIALTDLAARTISRHRIVRFKNFHQFSNVNLNQLTSLFWQFQSNWSSVVRINYSINWIRLIIVICILRSVLGYLISTSAKLRRLKYTSNLHKFELDSNLAPRRTLVDRHATCTREFNLTKFKFIIFFITKGFLPIDRSFNSLSICKTDFFCRTFRFGDISFRKT